MAGHETKQVRPKTAQDHLRIAAGSPLAIQGIFLEIIRERFRPDAGLEWVWDADPTLTNILIETSYNEEIESRNKVPAVYVTRLQSTPTKMAVGDRSTVHLPDHQEVFKALMRIDLQLECVSNDEGESTVIADIVQFMILASQDVIQREFGFYSFTHPVLGQTLPQDREQVKWATPISFSVEFWIHWAQVPIAPLLQQLSQKITLQGRDAFRQTVLNSMRRAT